MSKRKNSSSESSSSSNKKRHIDDDAVLTDARYEELYERYCKPWDQLNAEYRTDLETYLCNTTDLKILF